MSFKRGDIVTPKNNHNFSEAVVDLVLWDQVYLTPRGKMSLSHPERIIINSNQLLPKRNDKYSVTTKQIEEDYYEFFWRHIDLNSLKDINDFKEWDVVVINWDPYKFQQYYDWHAMFVCYNTVYELKQEDLNKEIDSMDELLKKIYWYWLDKISVSDKEPEQESITTPEQIPLIDVPPVDMYEEVPF